MTALRLGLLCACLFLTASCRGGEGQDQKAAAYDKAKAVLKKDDASPSELAQAAVIVAESGKEEAVGILKEFLGSEKSLQRMKGERGVFWPLGEVLCAIASSQSGCAEALLIDGLDELPTFGRFAPDKNYLYNQCRIRAIGWLKKPSGKAFGYLERVLATDNNHVPDGLFALSCLDCAESKAILLAYAKRKPVKNEVPRFLELLPATRNRPMDFELLVESYLAIREKILLGFILEEGWPTNQRMPYPGQGVADYSSVSPSHAKRFLAALEKLEKGLKEGELKPEETKRLQEIRALLTKKRGEFEKAQEKGATIAPKDDAGLWALIEDAFNPDEPRRKAALESLGKADKDQILSVIVCSLGQEPRRQRAVWYVKLYLKDRRLVPFLATLIKYADGEALRLAVQAAREIPDSRFLPVLMENALDSRHHMQSRSPGPRSTVATFSVFAETAQTLHVITGGKIGLAEYREGDYAEAKRNQLKEEWRAWWGQNEPFPDWAKEVERESALKPKEIQKVVDLAGVVCSGGPGERQKAIEELTGQDREQMASAMAWMLERAAFRRRALTVLREQQGLRDPRLLPFLAGVIKHTGGETLLWAVQVANVMPDESLLPALIENALNSEYVRTEAREVGGDRIAYYVVVLSEVGLALHKISKGQIGVDRLTESGLVLEKDKKRLAWREWWERRRER